MAFHPSAKLAHYGLSSSVLSTRLINVYAYDVCMGKVIKKLDCQICLECQSLGSMV